MLTNKLIGVLMAILLIFAITQQIQLQLMSQLVDKNFETIDQCLGIKKLNGSYQ